jgi:TolA-binding protein
VRLHVRDQAADFKRWGEKYEAPWTPTILILDSEGQEQHRIEGFLPRDEFLAQLLLGLGHSAFHHQEWSEAESWFRELMQELPETDAAPEATYWAGAARYKDSGDAGALAETARTLSSRWGESAWTKKASVWGAHAA